MRWSALAAARHAAVARVPWFIGGLPVGSVDHRHLPALARFADTLIVGAALLVAGFMLSMVVFAVLAALALVAWGYLWWKTRDLRRELRERPAAGGRVIEGEVILEPQDKPRP